VVLLTVCRSDPDRAVYDNILKTEVFTARNLCSNPAGVFFYFVMDSFIPTIRVAVSHSFSSTFYKAHYFLSWVICWAFIAE
jgi:hypothetical protein